MDFAEVATGALGVASGGVFGLLGSIGSSWLKGRAQEKQRDHEIKLITAQQAQNADEHHMNMAESRQEMSSAGLVASINADVVTGLPPIAAAIKALYRPFLTTFLVAACIYIFTLLLDALDGGNAIAQVFPRTEIVEMIRYTVYSLVFSTATAITWWFGDRALSPPHLK